MWLYCAEIEKNKLNCFALQNCSRVESSVMG